MSDAFSEYDAQPGRLNPIEAGLVVIDVIRDTESVYEAKKNMTDGNSLYPAPVTDDVFTLMIGTICLRYKRRGLSARNTNNIGDGVPVIPCLNGAFEKGQELHEII